MGGAGGDCLVQKSGVTLFRLQSDDRQTLVPANLSATYTDTAFRVRTAIKRHATKWLSQTEFCLFTAQ